MGHKNPIAIGLLMLSVVLWGGCSSGSSDSSGSWSSDKPWSSDKLAAQVRRTDHVVASDWYHGSRLVLTGSQLTDLIQGIASAKGLPQNVTTSGVMSWKLEFFCQTKLLATLAADEGGFSARGERGDYMGDFIDQSGAFKALKRRLESDPAARKIWLDYLAFELLRTPAFSNLQAWSLEALQRFQSGELKLEAQDSVKDSVLNQRVEGAVRTANNLSMPVFYIRRNQSGHAECLQIDWDAYGLLVGPSNYVAVFEAPYLTNAAPGIYAYYR